MKQRSGSIIIRFKEGLSEEKEQELINLFYKNNKESIEGMEYTGFDDTKPITTIKSFIKTSFS